MTDRLLQHGSTAAWIATDGGPLLLVLATERRRWQGSFVPGTVGDFVIETASGPFAFRTDPALDEPTDYNRACRIHGLVGALAVGESIALVLDDHPLETTWQPLADGGLLTRVFSVDTGVDPGDGLATLPGDAHWTDEGIVLRGAAYVLMDALDHGEAPEREPLPVEVAPGSYRVLSATIQTPGVTWVCVRLVRIDAHS